MRLILFLFIFSIQSCATYMQDKIGEEFKSIQPDYSNFENANAELKERFTMVTEDYLHQIEEQIELVTLLLLH